MSYVNLVNLPTYFLIYKEKANNFSHINNFKNYAK